jgi:hypothetical protein
VGEEGERERERGAREKGRWGATAGGRRRDSIYISRPFRNPISKLIFSFKQLALLQQHYWKAFNKSKPIITFKKIQYEYSYIAFIGANSIFQCRHFLLTIIYNVIHLILHIRSLLSIRLPLPLPPLEHIASLLVL